MGCVFCEIVSGGAPAAPIYEDGDVLAIMDRYPIDRGHCLVVTKRHYETISEMDAAGVGRVFGAAHAIAGAALRGLGADAFSIAQNNGKAARQVVPHVHVHIIPRYNSTGTDWSAGRDIAGMEELERLAGLIRPHVKAAGVQGRSEEASASAAASAPTGGPRPAG